MSDAQNFHSVNIRHEQIATINCYQGCQVSKTSEYCEFEFDYRLFKMFKVLALLCRLTYAANHMKYRRFGELAVSTNHLDPISIYSTDFTFRLVDNT